MNLTRKHEKTMVYERGRSSLVVAHKMEVGDVANNMVEVLHMMRPTIKQWEVKGRGGLMEKMTVTSYMIRRQRTLPPTIITGKAQESVFKVTLGDGVVS